MTCRGSDIRRTVKAPLNFTDPNPRSSILSTGWLQAGKAMLSGKRGKIDVKRRQPKSVRSNSEKPEGTVVSIQPRELHDSYIMNPCSPERTVVDAGEDYAVISPRSVALP